MKKLLFLLIFCLSIIRTGSAQIPNYPYTTLIVPFVDIPGCSSGNYVKADGTGCGTPSGSPTGTAGGDLSGTYPNPTVAQVNGAVVPTSADVLASNGSNQVVAAGAITGHSMTPQLIDCSTACSPTAAQLSNALVRNYGQTTANVQITGPTVAAGMNFIMIAGTAQASNYWRYTSTTANIYLDGSSTAVTNIIFAAPAIGNSFSCFSFQIGSSTYALKCTTLAGTSTSS